MEQPSGDIRPVMRIAQRITEAEKLGFRRFILPEGNMKGLDAKKLRIELVPVRTVTEALARPLWIANAFSVAHTSC